MTTIQPIIVPKWGMEMEEGTIAEWHVDEGSHIKKGDVLVDIETSKIVNTLESNYAGVLRKRIAKVGVTLPVGSLLGVCVEGDASEADIEQFVAKYTGQLTSIDAETFDSQAPDLNSPESVTDISVQVKASPSARKLAKELGVALDGIKGTGPKGRVSKDDVEKAAITKTTRTKEVKASPVAKRLAQKLGVDINAIVGTGVHGRVSKEDVEKAASKHKRINSSALAVEEPITENEYEVIPFTATRKTIAKRLVTSKQTIPHFYLNVSCVADNLLAFRQQLNESNGSHEPVHVSINDIVIKAAALALQAVPVVNSQLSEDGILQFSRSHISVAMATERGLLTPVVRDAERKSLGMISKDVRALSKKAVSATLSLDDLEGGTFSISNLGMLGIEEFSAVINPPQAAILAVGAMKKMPTVINDDIQVATVFKVTLSCDHRLVDGADGARWLQRFKNYIESPATMLL